jgi:membrane-associated phospholipid phosphatase
MPPESNIFLFRGKRFAVARGMTHSPEHRRQWWEKLRNHQIALWALAFTIAGCNLPLAQLTFPSSVWVEKALYDAYLIGSVWLLWKVCCVGKPTCWAALDALLLTYILVPLCQLTLRLPRPNTSPIEILYGFPSGHSVAVFALAWLIHLSRPSLSVPWFGLATIVALSRVASQYHHGYQVAAGATIGLLLGWWLSGRPVEMLTSYRLWRWLSARVVIKRKVTPPMEVSLPK